jgi:uncharacterized membrane protein
MAKKSSQKQTKKTSDSKTYAFIATFLSIIGFIIALLAWKNDKYVMYYAKQSLVVFIAMAVVGIASMAIGWIPIVGWVIMAVLDLAIFLLWLFSWIYALSGKEKEVPFIGSLARKIEL